MCRRLRPITCFVMREGVHTRDEFDEAANGDQWLKILVVRDSKSGSTFAHGVPRNGLDDKGFIVLLRCRQCSMAWLFSCHLEIRQ